VNLGGSTITVINSQKSGSKHMRYTFQKRYTSGVGILRYHKNWPEKAKNREQNCFPRRGAENSPEKSKSKSESESESESESDFRYPSLNTI
jgi:hypothetical protein